MLIKHCYETKAVQLTSVRYREVVISMLHQIKQKSLMLVRMHVKCSYLSLLLKLFFLHITDDFKFLNKIQKLSETLED